MLDQKAPLSGLVFAVLFGLGSGLWVFEQPARGSDTKEVVAFFEGTSAPILIGGTMSLVSIVFLVWFGSVLHDRLAAADGSGSGGLPRVAFAGVVLLGAVGLGAETVNMAGALSADDGQLTGESAQVYFDLSYAFGAHAAGPAIAMIALPIGLTALRSRTEAFMPAWAGWAALALGFVMLTPAILNRVAFLLLYALTVVSFAALSIHLHRT